MNPSATERVASPMELELIALVSAVDELAGTQEKVFATFRGVTSQIEESLKESGGGMGSPQNGTSPLVNAIRDQRYRVQGITSDFRKLINISEV